MIFVIIILIAIIAILFFVLLRNKPKTNVPVENLQNFNKNDFEYNGLNKNISYSNLSTSTSIPYTKLSKAYQNRKIQDILEKYEGVGKTRNPLYRNNYEINYPAGDFSQYIIKWIEENDIKTLVEFLELFYNYDYDSKVDTYASNIFDNMCDYSMRLFAKNNIRVNEYILYNYNNLKSNKKADNCLKQNLSEYEYDYMSYCMQSNQENRTSVLEKYIRLDYSQIVETDTKFYNEIKALLILFQDETDLRKRICLLDLFENSYIYYSLGIYDFKFTNKADILLTKRDFVNKWNFKCSEFHDDIVEELDDLDYWLNIPNLPQNNTLSVHTDLLDKVKTLGLIERSYFLHDFALDRKRRAWSGEASYQTRYKGINEKETLSKLQDLNLIEHSTDYTFIKDKLLKSDLMEICTDNNIVVKPSWTKDKIIQAIIDTDDNILKNCAAKLNFFQLNPYYEDDMDRILLHIKGNIDTIRFLLLF